ncbi:unnamed protein product [Euphydryas editha]|uniref:Uncharacterized protein n=1 Tax=Euphydryas editha TaxID=104508 RepID=A0AAU9U941_EUPED|nr:unnamed protein product [Euphydryas editha]
MKLEWTESESDYGLEETAFYEAPAAIPPPPRKHVSFSLRLDLCDEGGGAPDGIKTEPPEPEEPRAMQKVPSLSDLTDPEASLGGKDTSFFVFSDPVGVMFNDKTQFETMYLPFYHRLQNFFL